MLRVRSNKYVTKGTIIIEKPILQSYTFLLFLLFFNTGLKGSFSHDEVDSLGHKIMYFHHSFDKKKKTNPWIGLKCSIAI